jgi:hypothetical protein
MDILYVLVYKAAKTIENPELASQGTELHAMSQPLDDTKLLSTVLGMMQDARTITPAQIICKKIGCEARTTRDDLLNWVQNMHPSAMTTTMAHINQELNRRALLRKF